MQGFAEHLISFSTSLRNSVLQEHEYKILFIMILKCDFRTKRQDFAIRKCNVFMDINGNLHV